ncbi:MAG: CHAT domain-containing protein [Spirosoma sp.]|nr:CHAT domain-containing protein [Spirosoma sp.]
MQWGKLIGNILIGCLTVGGGTYAQCHRTQVYARALCRSTILKPDKALQEATAVLKQWPVCGQSPDSTYVGLLLFRSDQFRQLEQYDSARTDINKAIRLGQSMVSSGSLLAHAFCLSGYLHLVDGQTGRARDAFAQAVSQATRWPGAKLWGIQAQVNLAYLYSSTGDYQQAITHAEEGQQWAKLWHDYTARASLLREKAYALYWLRRYTEAALCARQSIQLAGTAAEINLGPYYLLLGDIEAKQGNYSEAVDSYKQANWFAQQANDKALQASVQTNLGFLYYQQHNYAQAIECNRRALAGQKNKLSQARIYDNMAACHWKMGQFEQALRAYQKGLTVLPIGFSQGTTTVNPSATSVRLVFKKEVLLTLMQDKADTWLDYAKATGSRQRLQHALATYRVADQMIDFMRWEHTGQQSKLFWRQKTRGMYERAIETCYRLGDAEQAFRFMEKSRAVMLADQLNELGARQQLAPTQVKQEQPLRQAVTDQQATLAVLTPDSSAYASARSELLNRQDRLDAFLKQLEASNPAYYRYKYDNTTPSLADLKTYLKPRQAQFVSYFAGDSALYVLAVAAGRNTLIRQRLGTYKQTVRQFMNLLANPDAMNQTANVQQFLQLGNGLYRQLLAPLGLSGGRVIVSPDGAFVPVEALSRSATKPDYLVLTHAFSYAYSAGLLLKTQPSEPAGWRQTDFLGVAPVSFAPALGQVSLPGSDGAVQDIARRFGSAVLLTRAQATRRAFLTEAAHARVVHLFTHGTATDSIDTEPRLYFADSTLNLSELGTDGLPATQLVVLAACKTGVGSYQRGEGVFSMARGFAALGVPSVLTTLWSVDNQATYAITDLFEQYLTRGLSKDEALQQAQRDWLTTADGAGQLPTYWAGLILVGNTEPLSQPTPWPWLAGGLGGLVVGSAWLWRRKRRTTSVISSLRQA